MEEDWELIEKAALAMGRELPWEKNLPTYYKRRLSVGLRAEMEEDVLFPDDFWNPLLWNENAFELLAALQIELQWRNGGIVAVPKDCIEPYAARKGFRRERREEAIRRAVTTCAARMWDLQQGNGVMLG